MNLKKISNHTSLSGANKPRAAPPPQNCQAPKLVPTLQTREQDIHGLQAEQGSRGTQRRHWSEAIRVGWGLQEWHNYWLEYGRGHFWVGLLSGQVLFVWPLEGLHDVQWVHDGGEWKLHARGDTGQVDAACWYAAGPGGNVFGCHGLQCVAFDWWTGFG